MVYREELQALLEIAKIEDVLGKFLELKKSGTKFLACCPFHNDKTPSFCVSPHLGIYKCFGCGESGDVLNFLQKFLALSFSESLEYLANQYDIKINKSLYQKKEAEKEENGVLSALNLANELFIKNINQAQNKHVLKYLNNRKISLQTIEKLKIGYAPDGWNTLHNFLQKRNFTEQILSETGLFIEKNNTIYDRFRDRVTFPIHNIMGDVVAFGARVLNLENQQAKYINSPESPFFEKRKTLYGIFQAKQSIRKNNKCFILEGYTDVIAMLESGIDNAVASMGTSLTLEQIALVKRYSQNVTLIFDGDNAGIKASIKNLSNLLNQDIYPSIVPMPEGTDPHELFTERGGNFLKEYIAQKEEDFVTFKAKFLFREAKEETIAKTIAIKELIDDLNCIKDDVYKAIVAQKCATIFDVKTEIFLSKKKEKEKKFLLKSKFLHTNTEISQEKKESLLEKSSYSIELFFFRLLFHKAYKKLDSGEDIATIAIINLDDYSFSNENNKKIWNIAIKLIQEKKPFTINAFTESDEIDNKTKSDIIDLFIEKYSTSDKWQNIDSKRDLNEKLNLYKNIFETIYNMKILLIKKLKAENLKNLTEQNYEKYLTIHEKLYLAEEKMKKEIEKIKLLN